MLRESEVVIVADQRRLTRSERKQRDHQVMQLFVAGATYRKIGQTVGLRSVSGHPERNQAASTGTFSVSTRVYMRFEAGRRRKCQ
jgi:hypothetical protein